jgi:hypothetical protein
MKWNPQASLLWILRISWQIHELGYVLYKKCWHTSFVSYPRLDQLARFLDKSQIPFSKLIETYNLNLSNWIPYHNESWNVYLKAVHIFSACTIWDVTFLRLRFLYSRVVTNTVQSHNCTQYVTARINSIFLYSKYFTTSFCVCTLSLYQFDSTQLPSKHISQRTPFP